jgi:hypothetical protein
VVTASFRTSVGETVAFAWCDEVARWNDDALGANPAAHVIGSLAPALVTLPNAKMYLVSSPWTTSDFHAKQFDLGETAAQCVAFGTTWEINPDISEQETREAEPHHGTWLREYAGIPPDGAASPFFEPNSVERSVDPGRFNGQLSERALLDQRPIITLDQAFGSLDGSVGNDNFGCCAVTHEAGPLGDLGNRGPSRVVVHEVGEWRTNVTPTESAQRVQGFCAKYGVRTVYMDQASGLAFAELLKQQGLYPKIVPWTHSSRRRTSPKAKREKTAPQYATGGLTNTSKTGKFTAARNAFLDNRMSLPSGIEHVLQQLRTIQSELAPSGLEQIVVPRSKGSHCDAAVALVLGISIALEFPPSLPPHRMTDWEKRQRILRERAIEDLWRQLC